MVIISLFLISNCGKVSIGAARPLEQEGLTILQSAAKNKESMTDAAYKVWLKENVLGRRAELPFKKALPIQVAACEASSCDAKYKIVLELYRQGTATIEIVMWTNDSTALKLSKSERLFIRGVITDLTVGTFLTNSVILTLNPVEFEVLKD